MIRHALTSRILRHRRTFAALLRRYRLVAGSSGSLRPLFVPALPANAGSWGTAQLRDDGMASFTTQPWTRWVEVPDALSPAEPTPAVPAQPAGSIPVAAGAAPQQGAAPFTIGTGGQGRPTAESMRETLLRLRAAREGAPERPSQARSAPPQAQQPRRPRPPLGSRVVHLPDSYASPQEALAAVESARPQGAPLEAEPLTSPVADDVLQEAPEGMEDSPTPMTAAAAMEGGRALAYAAATADSSTTVVPPTSPELPRAPLAAPERPSSHEPPSAPPTAGPAPTPAATPPDAGISPQDRVEQSGRVPGDGPESPSVPGDAEAETHEAREAPRGELGLDIAGLPDDATQAAPPLPAPASNVDRQPGGEAASSSAAEPHDAPAPTLADGAADTLAPLEAEEPASAPSTAVNSAPVSRLASASPPASVGAENSSLATGHSTQAAMEPGTERSAPPQAASPAPLTPKVAPHQAAPQQTARAGRGMEQPEPLRPSSYRFLRPLLGFDPAAARIYRGPAAAAVAAAYGADAVAGNDVITVGAGNTEDTPRTLGLLAHELTHVARSAVPGFLPPVVRQLPAAHQHDEEQVAQAVEAAVSARAIAGGAGESPPAAPATAPRQLESVQPYTEPQTVQPHVEPQPATTTTPLAATPGAGQGTPAPGPRLPAPWEPMPAWVLAAARPTSEARHVADPGGSPPSTPTGAPHQPGAAPPIVQAAPQHRSAPAQSGSAPAAPAPPPTAPARAPEPDLDDLARRVYQMLKQRLGAERRRHG